MGGLALMRTHLLCVRYTVSATHNAMESTRSGACRVNPRASQTVSYVTDIRYR